MILAIDTSDQERVSLTLISKERKFEHHFISSRDLSERLSVEIQKFLAKQKVKLSQLKKIAVFPGPGHFSRIRTAVATTNALAYGLNLNQKPIKPVYDRAPNITKPKFGRRTSRLTS